MSEPRILVHKGDLPEGLSFGKSVAVDTETLGLRPHRDRLCVVQLSAGDGSAHLVQFAGDDYGAPRLKAVLADRGIEKIFHFARFDVAVLKHYLGVVAEPLFCTKIASKLVRTYTDRHGTQGSDLGTPEDRTFETATEFGLGGRRAIAGTTTLCRL